MPASHKHTQEPCMYVTTPAATTTAILTITTTAAVTPIIAAANQVKRLVQGMPQLKSYVKQLTGLSPL